MVEVRINIFEGQKLTIERINIIGNSVTNDSVIRGELIVDEGDPFSTLLVNKSINKIKSRNLFGAVEYKTLPGSTDDLKVLEITVAEKATGEISAGICYPRRKSRMRSSPSFQSNMQKSRNRFVGFAEGEPELPNASRLFE